MAVFDNYSLYYDLLYRDKDYIKEAEYIDSLVKKHSPHAESILELGCGTGYHAELLAKKGYDIFGIDFSSSMLEAAGKRKSALPDELAGKINFLSGDVREVRVNKKFDAVISLFHVMSYQISNEDIYKAFLTASEHLNTGGIFIFDCWYGPAVLTDRPAARIKQYKNECIEIIRIAEPEMLPNNNAVIVNYQMFVKDDRNLKEIKETHKMRYLFKPEIELLLKNTGMKLIHDEEWITGRNPGFDTWNVCFIGEKE